MRKVFWFCFAFLFYSLSYSFAGKYYWEAPTRINSKNTYFLHSASHADKSLAVWQEVVPSSGGDGVLYVSLAVYSNGKWQTHERITPAIHYGVIVPSITSATIGKDGSVVVAAITEKNKVVIYKSKDEDRSFEEASIELPSNDFSSPYITSTSDGSYLLFLSKGSNERFSLFTSFSENGREWGELKSFVSSNVSDRAFLPTHASSPTGKTSDVVVFQAIVSINGRKSYQLFSTRSVDGGRTFAFPQQITQDANYQNERPDIKPFNSKNHFILTWERTRNRSNNVSVAFLLMDSNGLPQAPPSDIFSGAGKAINPKILVLKQTPIITWTHENDGRSDVYVYDAETDEAEKIRSMPHSMLFSRPYNIAGNLELLWQEGGETKHIMHVRPDNSVQKARLIGSVEEGKNKKKLLKVKVSIPSDSSGIAGYSYAWAKDAPPTEVREEVQKYPTDTELTFQPEEDGDWYVGVKVKDYAGNWSKISSVACIIDTTPPVPPEFELLELDEDGYCTSNTLRLGWKAPEIDEKGRDEEQIKGYTWSIEHVNLSRFYNEFFILFRENHLELTDDALQGFLKERVNIKGSLPLFTREKNPYVDLKNYDNGIYALSVAAIDEAGNIGKPGVKFFALNKFVAYTVITNVDVAKEPGGAFSLSFSGRGFRERGDITEVILDKDGRAPYDLVLKQGEFSIVSDRLVSKIKVDDLEAGEYRLGVSHPSRGLYFASSRITVTEMGTIKFGNFDYEYKHKWYVDANVSGLFNFSFYVRVALFCLLFFSIALYVIGVAKIVGEYKELQLELYLVLKGDGMSDKQKAKKSKEIRTRGVGLRFKLVLFTLMLVISIILVLAIPLLNHFSKTQKSLLANSLVSKTETVLENIVSSSRSYLQEKNILELALLTTQANDIDDVIFSTITSKHQDAKKEGYDFVWASSDTGIANHIDTDTLQLGQSKLKGYMEEDLNEKLAGLNEEASEYIGELSRLVADLNKEALNYVFKQDDASKEKRDEIQAAIRQTEEQITERLKGLANDGMGSYPEFDATNLSRDQIDYLFYKPILYRQSGDDASFVHGVVYLKVSIENLLNQVQEKQREVLAITLTISLIALFAGILGAWILATIITRPLKALAVHVAMIRDTEDKEKLAGKSMKLRQKDEVGLLAEIINEMTENLIKSAAAAKDLTVGKEIQKMFIPLDTDATGRKLISGKRVDEHIEFFGYYEGAKGVSGDYFDYIKLDDRHYAIIKCDVSGKGVPASLIMVEVATLFSNYFKDWTFKKNGFNMSGIVGQINDAIETRGFKGRFAAFTLCIFDSMTGSAYFCNAGDNIINIYDSHEKKMKEIVLKETAAAGVFPTMLVDMKGGFPVEKITVKPGDILFLYTDGIEEAKRMFRDENLQVIVCSGEEGMKEGDWHETHVVGESSEEMGKERVQAIIEAVLEKKVFRLKKLHNPIKDEEFTFDFTKCEGSIQEAILALVSVEKIFRLYQDKTATNFDYVIVDKQVDLFLNKHFLQYPVYCLNREPHPEWAEYLYYTNIRQDEQYDDLTILAVKKR